MRSDDVQCKIKSVNEGSVAKIKGGLLALERICNLVH